MSRKDSYTRNDDLPRWLHYQQLNFNSAADMFQWIKDDKINFSLSDKVYDAMIHCLKNDMEKVLVATISVRNESAIDIIIRKPNFQKILSGYIERLINTENYEKLAEIKKQIEKYNLEI